MPSTSKQYCWSSQYNSWTTWVEVCLICVQAILVDLVVFGVLLCLPWIQSVCGCLASSALWLCSSIRICNSIRKALVVYSCWSACQVCWLKLPWLLPSCWLNLMYWWFVCILFHTKKWNYLWHPYYNLYKNIY